MYAEFLKQIEKYQTIIIHRHTFPDGDALGSQIGLKHIIKENFPQKHVYVVGDAAKRFSFMTDSVMDEISDDVYTDALAIVLDSAEKSLIADNRYTLARQTLRFDHHIFCEKICDLEIIDTSFESCAGLITAFAMNNNLKVNETAAESLFTGIITDSGRFRYDSTTPETFNRAAFLLKCGVNTSAIYANLYSDDFAMVKLRASLVLKIQFTDNNVAYMYHSKEDVINYGVDEFTISRGMVNVMGDIKGVDIWVNFTQSVSGSILCELRSKKYNINTIAVKYGGGGHEKASGAKLENYEQVLNMLEDLNSLMSIR